MDFQLPKDETRHSEDHSGVSDSYNRVHTIFVWKVSLNYSYCA